VTEQHRKDGTSNQTAEVVVDEAAIDPVRDVIEGSMPVLLMYLLNGVEQANRYAFDSSLRLDYAEYMRRIAGQLVSVPAEAKALGRMQLKGFLDSVGRPELVAVIDNALSAAAGHNEEKPKSIRSLANYITPSKIAIDLHPYGHGNVLAAAQAVDHLVGPINQAMPAKFGGWASTLGRAVQHLARAKLGMHPDWGRLA
jgi:hypothetical protein